MIAVKDAKIAMLLCPIKGINNDSGEGCQDCHAGLPLQRTL